jgi:uncharacterized protein
MIINTLASELNVQPQQIQAAVALLDDGATVPFIARYRKEATNGLDDAQLRQLETRLSYLRELADRKKTILKSIDEQGKLTPALAKQIDDADTKQLLEDLYLPYKPKRRTKGQIAIEAGIAPLADALFNDPTLTPEIEAEQYLNADAGFADSKAVLDGAKFILMERFAEDAQLLQRLRGHMTQHGYVVAKVMAGKEKEAAKFSDYFAHQEKFKTVPSHRALAMFRGRNEGYLALNITLDPNAEGVVTRSECEDMIAAHVGVNDLGRPADKWLQGVVTWTWKIKILLSLETELFNSLREKAESEAINVFAKNLNDLLMAAPAGPKVTMGLDPGIRTGVKVAVVDQTGKVLATATIFPHPPQNAWDKSMRTLANLCQQHKVDLISIGNGTGSRETDKLVAEMMKKHSELNVQKIMISEAGASVYSASELASAELPNLDVSLRGAVSIARRLQDPLAELVKIEPKAIGVGQYQHDVSQVQLGQSLTNVIEDCVNKVGVDLNTASPALLANVSGLNKTLAQNIVAYRDANGAFVSRKALLDVPRLGPKAFEQAAGFLRINAGDNPLDASAVHPEAYPVVDKILANTAVAVNNLIGNTDILRKLAPTDFMDDSFGEPTIKDIISELEKPGRDPRPEFKTASYKEGVESIKDLTLGMVLEGVVSNVANFGAFVDIGVHQDGLVHISAMTNGFISDPRDVVKTGDVVKVKVVEVDADRKRISLTMRLDDEVSATPAGKKDGQRQSKTKGQPNPKGSARHSQRQGNHSRQSGTPVGGGMADAFAAAMAKQKK